MKTLTWTIQLFLIILGVVGFSSCEKRDVVVPGTGEASFSITMPTDQTLKSAGTDSSEVIAWHLLISVKDMNGKEVLTDELVPVYPFGGGFVSEKVKLETGKYFLTKFMVIDPSGKVIYASPLEGSPRAYLVKKPLPLPFEIRPNAVTTVMPEVLPVNNAGPEEFGYVNFGLQIVQPLHFYTICYLDNPNMEMPTRPTEAELTVYDETGWHYTFKLQAKVNHLVVRGGSEVYYFILKKEGYETRKLKFTAGELKATSWRDPLILMISGGGTEYKKLVLQPGPEQGKDAMICNLHPDMNFGDYKYFETTFLPDSVLAVMRSTRSLIWFDMNALPKSAIIKRVILQLYYDRPVPWDTTVFIMDPAIATDLCPWYGAVLQKITEPWEEHKVTWDTQPETTTEGQVYISPFRPFVSNVNFLNVDVTRLFVPSADETGAANYGMLFRLWPTERFPGFRFASSDYPIASMRPKLIIFYTMDR